MSHEQDFFHYTLQACMMLEWYQRPTGKEHHAKLIYFDKKLCCELAGKAGPSSNILFAELLLLLRYCRLMCLGYLRYILRIGVSLDCKTAHGMQAASAAACLDCLDLDLEHHLAASWAVYSNSMKTVSNISSTGRVTC